jgi:hypothetical protein
MSKATERAREQIRYVRGMKWIAMEDDIDELGRQLRNAAAALDCLEALRGPEWGCSRCGASRHLKDDMEFHVLSHAVARHSPNPWLIIDLHAEAWKKFEEAIGE